MACLCTHDPAFSIASVRRLAKNVTTNVHTRRRSRYGQKRRKRFRASPRVSNVCLIYSAIVFVLIVIYQLGASVLNFALKLGNIFVPKIWQESKTQNLRRMCFARK